MKKLMMIVIAFATLQVSAQEQKRQMRKQSMASNSQYSPEDMAQLQTKRMTLKLDLNDKQQKEVSTLFLEEAKVRQSKKEAYLKSKDTAEKKTLSKEDRLKMANARLDQQIERQKKMKTILSADQYEKWGKMNERRNHQGKKYTMRNKNKNNRMSPVKEKQ